MDEIKVTAKSLDDAITDASMKLGIPSCEMEYDILEKGSSGFLGIGKKDVVILARVKKEEALVKEDIEKEVIEVKNAGKEIPVKKDSVEKKEQKKEEKPSHEKKHHKHHRSHGKSKAAKEERTLVPVNEETKAICKKFLTDTLNKMGMDVNIEEKQEEDGSLYFDISGDDMGILIGKRGQTLDSLQYLVNRVAGKHQDGYIRIKLDTENYRERRKATLENLARNMASKVKRTKRNVVLEPMNPYERRVIHSALQEDEKVITYSEGNEPYRHVVVALKK